MNIFIFVRLNLLLLRPCGKDNFDELYTYSVTASGGLVFIYTNQSSYFGLVFAVPVLFTVVDSARDWFLQRRNRRVFDTVTETITV